MDFGVMIFPTDQSIQPVQLAKEVEARGFESLWFPEHSHIPVSGKRPGVDARTRRRCRRCIGARTISS